MVRVRCSTLVVGKLRQLSHFGCQKRLVAAAAGLIANQWPDSEANLALSRQQVHWTSNTK
jgi:hypothetical protein